MESYEAVYKKVYRDGDGEFSCDMDTDLDGGVTKRFLAESLITWRRMFVTCVSFFCQLSAIAA